MSAYQRPPVATPEFRNADGEIIEYGNQWDGPPPEDAYSVTAHPERYAPLHLVADALVEHLCETYDVEVDEGLDTASDLMGPHRGVIRSVRLRPRDATCAPVTFAFTDYPGIAMHAGLLHDFVYPSCGCDACDTTWYDEADSFEEQVFAVVTGNYTETVRGRFRPSIGCSFTYPDGGSSGSGGSGLRDVHAERVKAAALVLRYLPGGWAPWPRRTKGGSPSL